MSSIITKFTLFFCFCLSLLLALAVFGYFKKILILIVLVFGFLGFLASIFIHVLKKKLSLSPPTESAAKIEKLDLVIVMVIFLFSIFLGYFHHDLPRGRDDASYLSAAIKLSQTHSLSFEDKLTHVFTGFRNLGDDEFTSQFLPGYIVYLGTFYNLSGIISLFWANSLLIFLSLIYIYFIVKNLAGKRAAIISLLFLSTFYTTFWFPRRLVSENLFMMLFWAAAFLFFRSSEARLRADHAWQNRRYLISGLIPITLSLFVRGESIGFMAVYLFILLSRTTLRARPNDVRPHRNKSGHAQRVIKLFFISFNLFIFIYYLKAYKGLSYFISQFYSPLNFFLSLTKFLLPFFITFAVILTLTYFYKKEFFKKSLGFFQKNFQTILLIFILAAVAIYELFLFLQKNPSWNFYQIHFGFKILTFYFLVFYLIIVLGGLYHRFFRKEELLLTLLVLPSFLFLLRSNISMDLPWFLRRFYPVFIPFIFILAGVVFSKMRQVKERRLTHFLFGFFIIANLVFAWPILTFSENKSVSAQLKNFSLNFKKDDLIIMTPGWDWQKWAYPLHYFYDLQILPNLNLYPERKFIKEAKKYESKLDDDAVILQLKKDFDQKSFEEFKKIIPGVQDVYFLIQKDDLIIYPYAHDNLEFIKDLQLKYKFLTSDTTITKYIQKNSRKLNVSELNAKIRQIPPQVPWTKKLNMKLYKVKNKNALIFPKRLYAEEDILNFRRTLKKWLR